MEDKELRPFIDATLERLQAICDKHGCQGGHNRLDFIEATMDQAKEDANLLTSYSDEISRLDQDNAEMRSMLLGAEQAEKSLAKVLEKIAEQKLSDELEDWQQGDYETGYNTLVKMARQVLGFEE